MDCHSGFREVKLRLKEVKQLAQTHTARQVAADTVKCQISPSKRQAGRVHRGGGLDLGSGDGLADGEQRGRAENKGHRRIRVLAIH